MDDRLRREVLELVGELAIREKDRLADLFPGLSTPDPAGAFRTLQLA